MAWAILGFLVGVVAAWWFLLHGRAVGKKPRASPPPPPVKAPVSTTWGKKLVIPPGRMPCEQAIDLAGKSFPIDAAPPLPLAGCTVATCTCRYEPIPERRGGGERRNTHERRVEIRFDPEKPDRRSGKDRRKDAYHWESSI